MSVAMKKSPLMAKVGFCVTRLDRHRPRTSRIHREHRPDTEVRCTPNRSAVLTGPAGSAHLGWSSAPDEAAATHVTEDRLWST